MRQVNLTLYGEQTTLFQDWMNTDKHVIDIVPVGSGKTFLASIALPIFASDPRYHKGKDVLYMAPTREMLKTLIWEPLKASCREYFQLPDSAINNSELTIKFPNNVFLRLKSAEQRENLRGMNVGIAILDEAALYHVESLQEITNRLRPRVGQPDTQGRMIIISTPAGKGPLYDLVQTAKQLPDKYIVRHMNYIEMRSGDLEFIEAQRKILSPLKFDQDYNCSFEQIEDQFFYSWNKSYCVDFEDRGEDLYSFHDWNKKRMCAVVAQVKNAGEPNGTIEVLKSYAIKNCSTYDIGAAIRKDFPRRRINSVIDMSGTQTNRDTTSPFGVTDRTIIEQFGFKIINNRNNNPLIADTDNSSNSFIARGGLRVRPYDNLLLESLSTYHYEDATRKKLVKYTDANYAHIDGLGDCIRYGIHHLFPVQHYTPGLPDYITSDNKFSAIPGSQYLPQSPLYPGGPTWAEIMSNNTDNQDYVSW